MGFDFASDFETFYQDQKSENFKHSTVIFGQLLHEGLSCLYKGGVTGPFFPKIQALPKSGLPPHPTPPSRHPERFGS